MLTLRVGDWASVVPRLRAGGPGPTLFWSQILGPLGPGAGLCARSSSAGQSSGGAHILRRSARGQVFREHRALFVFNPVLGLRCHFYVGPISCAIRAFSSSPHLSWLAPVCWSSSRARVPSSCSPGVTLSGPHCKRASCKLIFLNGAFMPDGCQQRWETTRMWPDVVHFNHTKSAATAGEGGTAQPAASRELSWERGHGIAPAAFASTYGSLRSPWTRPSPLPARRKEEVQLSEGDRRTQIGGDISLPHARFMLVVLCGETRKAGCGQGPPTPVVPPTPGLRPARLHSACFSSQDQRGVQAASPFVHRCCRSPLSVALR